MSQAETIRVLVVDDDFSTIADYRDILCPQPRPDGARRLADLESELFGIIHEHQNFPAFDVVSCQNGADAVEAVRQAVEIHRPFAIAFIDLRLMPGMDGVQTAEQIRSLDPDLQIVVATAYSEFHPLDLVERIPPVDQLFYLQKPFHAFEIQQFVLALSAKWRAERSTGGQRRGEGQQALLAKGGGLSALKQLPVGIVVYDRRDRLLAANETMTQLLPELSQLFAQGAHYEDILRETARRLLPEDTLFLEEAWVRDRLEWHAKSGGILEQRLRGGRWLLLLEGGGTAGETYCLHIDISDLKKRDLNRSTADRMAQISKAFSAFCNRLNIAIDNRPAERPRAVEPGGEPPRIAKVDKAAAAEAVQQRLGQLTGKLQAIAQTQRLEPEFVALNQVVGEVVRQCGEELSPDLQFEVVSGAGLWPVHLDRAKLREVLRELVDNAAAAMEGSGPLTLETENVRFSREFVASRPGLAAGDHVRVTVRDSGPGMTQEMADRAFNPFFTSQEDEAHLGLGLSVAYGFVKQSGGHIEIEGGDEGGTSVHLYFPRSEPTTEILRQPAPFKRPGQRSSG